MAEKKPTPRDETGGRPNRHRGPAPTTIAATADLIVDDNGDAVLAILPTIDERLPRRLREGIARRRLTVLHGRCPCGAELVMPTRQQWRAAQRRGEVLYARVEHADDCPAIDPALGPH